MAHAWLTVEEVGPGWFLFVLAGETDMTADRLRRTLQESLAAGARGIVVDCGALRFLDTRTIDGLLGAFSELGEKLVIVAPPGDVRRVLELTGLDSVLRVRDSREEAFRELGVDLPPSGA